MDHIILMDIGCFFISLGSMYAGSVGTTAVPGPCWHPSPSVMAATLLHRPLLIIISIKIKRGGESEGRGIPGIKVFL